MAEENEEKMQELYVEFQMLNQHLKQLSQQQEMLAQQVVEMNASIQGLEEFSKAEEGSEMFVPLSAGIFAKVKVVDAKNLLMNVGAGVCVVKDVPRAKELMKKQLVDSDQLSQKIERQMEKFSKKASDVQRELQALLPKE